MGSDFRGSRLLVELTIVFQRKVDYSYSHPKTGGIIYKLNIRLISNQSASIQNKSVCEAILPT